MIDAPTQPLGDRYHFVAPFRYQVDTPRWLARDERSGENVVVAFVETARVAKLEAIKGFTHPHLGAIVDVVHGFDARAVLGGRLSKDGSLIVAEHVSGPTLRQQLVDAPVNPARVVAWWLRLAEVTRLVHKQGGVLGGISPFSVVGKAEGRAVPPVLTQLTAPVVGATLSPERLRGNPAEAADDVWALYASLYWALTGVAPFPGNTREALQKDIAAGPPTPVSAFGIRERDLEEIIQRGLVAEPGQRSADIEELIKSLDAWERGLRLPPRPTRGPQMRSLSGIVKGGLGPAVQLGPVAFDAAQLPRDFGPEITSTTPNPRGGAHGPAEPVVRRASEAAREIVRGRVPLESPPAVEVPPLLDARGTPRKQPSINPFAKKRSLLPVWLGLLIAGAAGAFFVVNLPKPVASLPSAAARATPSPAKSSPKSVESAAPPSNPTESLNACVRSYFADSTFEPPAQLDFVCGTGDHRELTEKLYELSEAIADRKAKAAAEASKDAGAPAAAGFQVDTLVGEHAGERLRRPLGWYELLATAVIRKGCCPNAAPVTLPETTGWCEQLQDVVRDLADDSSRAGDLAPRVKRFDKAVDCLFANRVRRPYKDYKTLPLTEENRSAFQQFLSHAAVSDAQRRTLGR